jgi:Leucine-rich repeat (LRR) protein
MSQFPKTLSTINLSGNRLTGFPHQLVSYSRIQMLDLSQNQLTSISPQICELKLLTTLICANNQLDNNSLPKDFGLSFANSLRVLSLSGNLVRILIINSKNLFFKLGNS